MIVTAMTFLMRMKKMKYRTDFVTNSSSSCFVCQINTSVEEVREKLQELLDFYNKFGNDNLSFGEVFEEPYVYTENMIPKGKDAQYAWQYQCQDSVGKIIIESKDDNSIPCEMFEFIETKFNTYRQHLG